MDPTTGDEGGRIEGNGAAASRPVPFDLMPTVTAVLDERGTVVGWSKAAAALTGWDAAEILGRSVSALAASPVNRFTPYDARPPWPGSPDQDHDLVVRIRHRDGGVLLLGVRATPLAHASGDRNWHLSAIDLGHASWWDASHAVLRRFLDRSPYGIAVLDTELRYVWVNETLERMAGVPLADRIGRRMHEVLPGLSPFAVERQMRTVLSTGVPVLDFEYQGTVPADPTRRHAFSTSFLRLDDDEGRVMGVCYMGVDITERRRTRERLTLLTESGARIGTTLDFVTTARELAATAVPDLADFAAVDLFDEVLDGQEPTTVTGRSGWPRLRRMAYHSVRPGSPEVVAALGRPARYTDMSPMARCLRDGVPVLEARLGVDDKGWLADDPDRRAAVAAWGLHSLIAVPLRARGTVLGLVVLMRSRTSDPFETDDLALAEELVSRAAICLDNARRYTREHNTALALQHSMLPQALPATSTLEIAHRYIPATGRGGVGGDWFDVIPLSGARVALVVGDVTGHGITSAATMGRLRTAVRTLADIDLPPDELLARLDDLVLSLVDEQVALQHDEGPLCAELGTTCLYAVYDPATRECTVASAGHPPPAVVTTDGKVTYPELPTGPPLGIGTLPFEAITMQLPEDALLVLFTDGLLLDDGRDLTASTDRLLAVLAAAPTNLEAACDDVVAAMLPTPQNDDVAVLMARPHGLDPDRIATWDLLRDPAVVADARAMAADTLRTWGLDDLVFTTELVVSELVTNAVRYACDPVRLRLIRQATLICEVWDGGSTSPRLKHARVTDEGGRGLYMVARLTRRWGTRYTPDGKVIWAEQSLEPDPDTF
ncbi:SpoIIE family protein phosphatase [Streptomyces sp. SID5474]|nr:SpoIIE family protein phosphatase [Streptomyces sp. SID5474]